MAQLTKLFIEFWKSEKAGGIILIISTTLSLLFSNVIFGEQYVDIWHTKVAGMTLEHWVNDGLMTLFFLLIGLELEREIYKGELSNLKNALMPIIAALGGAIIPAAIYFAFNIGTDTLAGSGIPTATDIAFAIGILSLLGNRVPGSLKIFLIALAVIDDLLAIIIISVFYTSGIVWINLLIAFGVFGILIIINRLHVMSLIPYLIGGIIMWYFMLHSGVHATITGVLLAFAIPFGKGDKKGPSYSLQHQLHVPVAWWVLPLFAFANTTILIDMEVLKSGSEPYALGVILGLVIGKPLGITLFSYISTKFGFTKLPKDLDWKQILSVAFLGGIGFTMSIFITILAFNDSTIVNNTKFMILCASLLAGILGYFLLSKSLPKKVIH